LHQVGSIYKRYKSLLSGHDSVVSIATRY